jgi:hypothetical protein
MDKKIKKRIAKKCCFCGVDDYEKLDCHRIIPGSKYTDWGTAVVCANCHRSIHDGKIIVLSKHTSTVGHVINYMENNEEKWTKC